MDKELKLLQETICQGCINPKKLHYAKDPSTGEKSFELNMIEDLAGRQKKNKQKKIEILSFDTTGLCEGQFD